MIEHNTIDNADITITHTNINGNNGNNGSNNNLGKYYLFALESVDSIIDGFHRFIKSFEDEESAIKYYVDNLEYQENIVYQTDKVLQDVSKCYVWNKQSGVLNLYFRHELKMYIAVGNLFNKAKTTELALQESRKIRAGSSKRYWFYFMNYPGYHVVTDAVLLYSETLDDNLKPILLNRYQQNIGVSDYDSLGGFYYFDSHTETTNLFISQQELNEHLNRCHFLCILNFETNNCNVIDDDNPDNFNEIIEITSILCKWEIDKEIDNDNENISIIDKFQKYIQPVYNSIITPECLQITGISQSTVENGLLFRDAFQQHYDWIKLKVPAAYLPKSTTIIMCDESNLKSVLVKNCVKNGIHYYPNLYKKCINIQRSFQHIFKSNEIYSIVDMLTHLGIDSNSSGKCYDIFHIISNLIKNNYKLNNKDIVTLIDKYKYKPKTWNNTVQ
jgi:inhibitor of KinA sporulation pathway (predicted exonuclease)